MHIHIFKQILQGNHNQKSKKEYLDEQNILSCVNILNRSHTAQRSAGPPQAMRDQCTGSKVLRRGHAVLAHTGRRGPLCFEFSRENLILRMLTDEI